MIVITINFILDKNTFEITVLKLTLILNIETWTLIMIRLSSSSNLDSGGDYAIYVICNGEQRKKIAEI